VPKTERTPDFSLFLDILHTLETIKVPYMIIVKLWKAIKEGAEREAKNG